LERIELCFLAGLLWVSACACVRRAAIAAALVAAGVGPACALEFRSVSDSAAILYDAPSVKGKKLYVLGRGYPVEVVVVVANWVKVRDGGGELAWLESRLLTDRRTVMVKVALAQIHESADDRSAIVFQAQQNVILDLVDAAGGGWLRVRHRDGQTGFVKAAQVWGA
jgi:SH3-like domain-containing protein